MKLKTLKDIGFDELWELIKKWDIGKFYPKETTGELTRKEGMMYSGATGTDVKNILEVIKKAQKQEAIKIFKNLQGPETIYPLILDKFPERLKGSYAKDLWDKNIKFRYGTEYGMLAMLFWLMNLTEEDLK